jgi:hypothetical protein
MEDRMRRVGLVVVLMMLCLGTGWAKDRKVAVPEGDCESGLYLLKGDKLSCAAADRARILTSQRNMNFLAWQAATAQVRKLGAEMVLNALHEDARHKCRELGMGFSEDLADCQGSLPKKE